MKMTKGILLNRLILFKSLIMRYLAHY